MLCSSVLLAADGNNIALWLAVMDAKQNLKKNGGAAVEGH